MEPTVEEHRVSATTSPYALGGMLARLARRGVVVEVVAIGPAAVNQAVKGVAVARRYLAEDDVDVRVAPSFDESAVGDRVVVSMRLRVEPVERERPGPLAEAAPVGGWLTRGRPGRFEPAQSGVAVWHHSG